MKNNKKSRKPRKTSPKGFQELSPVTLQCSLGLLQKVDNKALKQQDLHTVRLVYELPCNTDGSGFSPLSLDLIHPIVPVGLILQLCTMNIVLLLFE